MRWPALALCALVLAGCIGASPEPPSPPERSPPAEETPALAPITGPPTFAPPVLVTTIGNATSRLQGAIPQEEPYLHADRAGLLYLATPHVPALFRSTDGALSFATLFDVRTGEGNRTQGFTDAAFADANGTLYWLGLDFAGQDASLPFQVSRNGGASWSDPVVLARGQGIDRQWIASSADGHLAAIWVQSGAGEQVRTSSDGGATWTEVAPIDGVGFAGPVITGRDPGVFYVVGNEYTRGTVVVARSRDSGLTWTTATASPPLREGALLGFGPLTSVVPAIAEDQAGTLYVVYAADDGPFAGAPASLGAPVTAQAVFLVVSPDAGATWSAPLRISEPGRNAVLPWVVAGAPGRVAVAWYEDETGTNRVTPSVWHTVLAVSSEADADAPSFFKARANTAPAHVGRICNECGDFSRLDHLGLALTGEGKPAVAWVRDGAEDPAALDIVVSVADVSLTLKD